MTGAFHPPFLKFQPSTALLSPQPPSLSSLSPFPSTPTTPCAKSNFLSNRTSRIFSLRDHKMTTRKRFLNRTVLPLISFAAVQFAVCSAAHSAQFVVQFDAILGNRGSFLDPSGNFSRGDPVHGFWTVDTSVADTDSIASRGFYPQTGFPSFMIFVGNHSFWSTLTNLQMLSDEGLGIGTIDAYDVLGKSPSSSIEGLSLTQIQVTLRDTRWPLDAMSSDALLTTAPNPGSFDQVGQSAGQIIGYLNGQLLFMNLEILSTRLVPEPSACVLLSAALIGLAAGRIRNRTAAAG